MRPGVQPLLAEFDHWQSLVSRFRGEYSPSGTSGIVADVLILAILAVLFGSLAYLIWRQALETRANRPQALFGQLCAAHGLSASQRRLLKRLAVGQHLPEPALIFLEPAHFALERLPAELQAEQDQIVALRHRLFE